jgi:hypothetical protein
MSAVDQSALADLLSVVESMPRLPGAACKGQTTHDIDTIKGDRHNAAIEYATARCRQCPALSDCEKYLHSMAPGSLSGMVVAAQYVGPTAGRPGRPPKP